MSDNFLCENIDKKTHHTRICTSKHGKKHRVNCKFCPLSLGHFASFVLYV
ncbi:hypothetical protein Hanom_Chr03g00259261 [Helianthus anomalus]